MIFHFVAQAILPAAAFQAALGRGCAALWGRIASCWPVSNRPLRAEQPRPEADEIGAFIFTTQESAQW